jgi:Spy/CpxP family protein refolding chaperone
MRKTFLVPAILAATICCVPLAFAQRAGPAWHGHHGMAMGGHIYDKLGLSDAQRTRIRRLTRQGFAQAKPEMQSLRQARLTYESATPGTAAYETAASNLAETESDAARTRVTTEANLRAKIYQVLTPTQRTRLADMRAQRAARMQQWKEFQQLHPLPASTTQSTQ